MIPRPGWIVIEYVHDRKVEAMPHGCPSEATPICVVVPSKKVTNKAVDDMLREHHRNKHGWDPGELRWQGTGEEALVAHVEGESGVIVHYLMEKTKVYG